MLQGKYYIHTRSGAQKAEITAVKVHGHNKPWLSPMKPEIKTAKMLSQLPGWTPMNKSQPKIFPSRELGRAGLKRKLLGTHPLLKPKVVSKLHQIQRPTLPLQPPWIWSSQRVIQSTYVESKQPLNHRPRVWPRSEVKSRRMTKQNKHYSPAQTSPIYHPLKQQNYPERHFLDPPQQ